MPKTSSPDEASSSSAPSLPSVALLLAAAALGAAVALGSRAGGGAGFGAGAGGGAVVVVADELRADMRALTTQLQSEALRAELRKFEAQLREHEQKRAALDCAEVWHAAASQPYAARVLGDGSGGANGSSVAQEWASALNAHSVPEISALYDDTALLYATFSTVLHTPADIRTYFHKLFRRDKLRVSLNEVSTRLYADARFGINSGLYTFSYVEDDAEAIKVVSIPARFTFVFSRDAAGRMRILEHHSSVDPEITMTVTPVETRARKMGGAEGTAAPEQASAH